MHTLFKNRVHLIPILGLQFNTWAAGGFIRKEGRLAKVTIKNETAEKVMAALHQIDG